MIYLEVRCLICGHTSYVDGEHIDDPDYRCPHCGVQMAKSQWRKSKVSFFVGEELLRQAAGLLGDESATVEVQAFHVACKGPGGIPVEFNTDYQISATDKDLEDFGIDQEKTKNSETNDN